MKHEHVIFTAFFGAKYFDGWKAGIGKKKPAGKPALSPLYLESRLRYLEAVCFASILGQSNQDFTWVLAISPETPDRFLKTLEAMVASRPRSFLHRVDDARLERLSWLRPYLSSQTEPSRLITTNLDSDDGLDRQFTHDVQRIVSDIASGDSAPPILIVGFRDCVQWDVVRSWSAPFGWRAPWHRHRESGTLLSAGYSVATRFPDYPAIVTGVRHTVANRILDFSIDDPEAGSPYSLRRHVCQLAEEQGDDLSSWSIDETLVVLDGRVGLPIMLNHADTIQRRLGEAKRGRRRVWGPRSFPNVAVDWKRVWDS